MAADIEFRLAPDAERIGRDLIADHYPDLANADDVRILYVFSTQKRTKRGKAVWAKADKLSPLQRFLASGKEAVNGGEHFVITIGLFAWSLMTERQRVALVDHELAHFEVGLDDDGNRVYSLRPHDVEEFVEIIQRHGLWREELRDLGEVMDGQLPLPEVARP